MSRISWFKRLFAKPSESTSRHERPKSSPIQLEILEDRTAPAAALTSSLHAVASLPISRVAQMETSAGPVHLNASTDTGVLGRNQSPSQQW